MTSLDRAPGSLPTPPLPKSDRFNLYGWWAWGTVLIVSVIAGWAILGEVPKWLYALSVGFQTFGGYAGFMARNNVFPKHLGR